MSSTEEQGQEPLAELYRLLGRRLYSTALRMLRNPEEAEDVMQDAFLAFHRQGPGFEPRAAGAWLHRALVNRCLDRLRSRARLREEELGEEALPPASIGDRMDLERAVATLPRSARLVFMLHDVEGFRHREVAEMLGINEGTSKSQLFRARELLRAALRAPGEAARETSAGRRRSDNGAVLPPVSPAAPETPATPANGGLP